MRGSLLTPLAAAAFAAATINPAAAQFLLGNTGNWNTPSVGAPPYTFEARLYGGWSDASTFGWNVPADIVGGGAALRLPYGQFRFQADLSAEESNYSSSVGNPSFVVGATHFDWMVAPGSELGLFGGLDNALPSFSAPQNLNAFIGFEGRQFLGPAMFGLQAGYFDNVGGSGTLVRAGFVEGRFKLSLGDSIGIPSLRYTIVGADLGYASGTSTATSTGAQSTYWGRRCRKPSQIHRSVSLSTISTSTTTSTARARCGPKTCSSAGSKSCCRAPMSWSVGKSRPSRSP
jgi:hypothetical protein